MFKAGLSGTAAPAPDPTAAVCSGAIAQRPRQLLPRVVFLEQLSREKHRADRSRANLSLLLLEIDAAFELAHKPLSALLHALRIQLRDSDYIGLLAHNLLAVLLPDTDTAGVARLVDRMQLRDVGEVRDFAMATYPDQLFDRLEPHALVDTGEACNVLVDSPESRAVQSVLKRCIDICGALAGIALLSPIMLATAVAVKMTSPGPALFRQIRLGKDFAPFTFYKFRSMYSGADESVHRNYLEQLIRGNAGGVNQASGDAAFYKLQSDTRVTALGRLIRRTSIDELPQLVNVLRGEMSLVGPRPPIPYETSNYQPWHLRRILEVKPGLTGLWQVEGRSRTSFDDMVRMDLRYSREWSLLLDLKLILRTFRVVLECRGAV